MEHWPRVKISSVSKAKDTLGKTYYNYDIELEYPPSVTTRTIQRRFAQFSDLYTELTASRKLKVNFPSPSLLQFSLSKLDLANSRMGALEQFLVEVLSLNDLSPAEKNHVAMFLDIDHGSPSSDPFIVSTCESPPHGTDGGSNSGLEDEEYLKTEGVDSQADETGRLVAALQEILIPAPSVESQLEPSSQDINHPMEDNLFERPSIKSRQGSLLNYIDIDLENANDIPRDDIVVIGENDQPEEKIKSGEDNSSPYDKPRARPSNNNDGYGSSTSNINFWIFIAIAVVAGAVYIRRAKK